MPVVIEKELCNALHKVGNMMAVDMGLPSSEAFLLDGVTISEVAMTEASLSGIPHRELRRLAVGEWEDVLAILKRHLASEPRVVVGLVMGNLWGAVANQTAPTPPEVKEERPDMAHINPPTLDVDQALWRYHFEGDRIYANHPEWPPHVRIDGQWIKMATTPQGKAEESKE